MKKLIFFVCLLIAIADNSSGQYILTNAFPNLTFNSPLFLTHSNDNTNRVFVVQQDGIIRVFPNDSNVASYLTYLDVSSRISYGGERGLLGLAFHPNYAVNGRFYIYYTQVGTGNLIIARYNVSSGNPNQADFNSELILINIPHSTYSNHNGGMLFFGLDGYLYIGTGDGGGGGDPFNNGQNVNVILGKTLRINVDTTSGGLNYGIPPGNPFKGGGGRAEIFTWGMRNPWRYSQDHVTGLIWCADVGQNCWEEIDIIQVGKNYGWRLMEGMHCYAGSNCFATGCDTTNLTFPIKEYSSQSGVPECSVTGGYVYRGTRRPELVGRYIYGDYCSRKIWKLYYVGGIITEDALLLTAPAFILSFGQDQNRELYTLCSNGIIYRFNASVIGIGNNNSIPDNFYLYQNYPNPFNPSTKIKYSISEASVVTLKVFDLSGKEIANLQHGYKIPGTYDIEWDASGFPSGVYFYRLTAGKNSDGKKMVLLK